MSLKLERGEFVARPEWQFAQSEAEFDSQGDLQVELAWQVAKIAHRGQTRIKGEPYINHIVAVASIVRDVFGIKNSEIIASSLLHDVVEDCGDIGEEQLAEISELVGRKVDILDLRFISDYFGEKTAFSVDTVTKLETDKETVRKLLLQSFIDPVGAVDKIADRLHNMSTLDDMAKEKQLEKARETMNVHTHLAESLGIWVAKNRLEDEAFKYLEPERYWKVKDLIDRDPRLNAGFVGKVVAELYEWLGQEAGHIGAVVEVRVKGYWEADKKRKRLIEESRCREPETFADVADLVSFRILVDNLGEADTLLGLFRRKFQDIIDIKRADDFITEPADNEYYSAYQETAVVDGQLIEVAITTKDREEYNNWGVVSLLRRGETELAKYARIMVSSPNNEWHFLPRGATGLDYAGLISPRLLAQAVGMIIDDGEKVVDIREKVPNAAKVFVVTDSSRMAADPEWVNYCVTRTAKREIKRQQEQQANKELVVKGRARMEQILKSRGLFDLEDLDEETCGAVSRSFDVGGEMRDIYTKLGAEMMSVEKVNKGLDEAGIYKEVDGVRTTSLRLEGPDIEGTMASLTDWIAQMGGSLAFTLNRAGGGIYKARLVVKGLSAESEMRLRELMESDEAGRFARVELV